jgi:DNA-binding transcriptional regulator PaaX
VQFWDSFGMPEVMLPERWLGHRILELFAQRYPHLTGDVGMA